MSEQMENICAAQLWMGPIQKDWVFEESRRRYIVITHTSSFPILAHHFQNLPFIQLHPYALRSRPTGQVRNTLRLPARPTPSPQAVVGSPRRECLDAGKVSGHWWCSKRIWGSAEWTDGQIARFPWAKKWTGVCGGIETGGGECEELAGVVFGDGRAWDAGYACCDSANIVSSGVQRLRKGRYLPGTVFVGNAIAC